MAKAATGEAKGKVKPRPKLTQKERHKRFVDMAHEVGASEELKDFDHAFDKVTLLKKWPKPTRQE